MKRNIERFERRLDLIRQSLDIPGMSVAVVHKQAVILARGFGVVDIARGIEASENTPYPVASLTKPSASAVIMRLLFKMPDREPTLILLACTDRASSVFWPGNGDPLRSAFVTAFLDAFRRGS